MTATRPATQPDSAPSSDGLPLKIHSANIHDSAAAAVATNELIMASAAPPFASRLEPALKPNQPTHSSEAPIMVMTSECGAISSLPKPVRLPTTSAPTRPAMPALMCTTVPPAKSMAPQMNTMPASALTASSAACAAFLASGVVGRGECLGGGVDRVRTGPVPDHVGDREVDEASPRAG